MPNYQIDLEVVALSIASMSEWPGGTTADLVQRQLLLAIAERLEAIDNSLTGIQVEIATR